MIKKGCLILNIAFLAKYINASGVSIHMHDLAVEYIKKGHKVTIISGGPNSKEAQKIYKNYKESGVDLEKVPFPLRTTTAARAYKDIFLFILALPKGLKSLKKSNPDIIHVHWGVTSYIPHYFKKISKVPFVQTVHLSNFSTSFFHKKADGYIAVSGELANETKTKFQTAEIRTIFNGSDPRIFQPLQDNKKRAYFKKKLGFSNDKLIIGFVGSLIHRKGLDILFEAISKEMIDKYNLEILILGSGDNNYLKTLIVKKNLKEHLSHFEFQDPKDFYKVMDIFILPSRKEGFPLVCIEAMLTGVPVIRTNTGGAYDQIVPGKDGYICQSENSAELRNYLLKLLEDKILRINIGKSGREKALKNFTKEKMVEETLKFYELCKSR
jgi:glycosyltransferase involved in cell wall biosynthesis